MINSHQIKEQRLLTLLTLQDIKAADTALNNFRTEHQEINRGFQQEVHQICEATDACVPGCSGSSDQQSRGNALKDYLNGKKWIFNTPVYSFEKPVPRFQTSRKQISVFAHFAIGEISTFKYDFLGYYLIFLIAILTEDEKYAFILYN